MTHDLTPNMRQRQKFKTSFLKSCLPNRHGLNPTFLAMAIGAGMTSAITNPLEAPLMQAVRGADVLMDHDPQCGNWISAYREPSATGTRERRSSRRRRAERG